MTREEAIELFKDVEVLVFRDVKQKYFHEDIEEAFKLAIKALEQEPKTGHWIMPQQDDGMSDPIYYQVRCSECGFDLDPQTWHQELHQYGADKYCPNCGAIMKESEEKE